MAARADGSWRAQKEQHEEEQGQQQQNWHNTAWDGYGSKQPRILRRDDSWVKDGQDCASEFAKYDVATHDRFKLVHQPVHEQYISGGRMGNKGRWRNHWMLVSFPQKPSSSGAEGIERPPTMREDCAQRDLKNKSRSTFAVEGSEPQPKKKEKYHHEACKKATRKQHHTSQLRSKERMEQATRKQHYTPAQLRVKEHMEQVRRHLDSPRKIQTLPESAPSQETAGQPDKALAAGVHIMEAEPKLFDMTLNDYDDYETSFFPGSCDVATDDPFFSWHSDEGISQCHTPSFSILAPQAIYRHRTAEDAS